METATDLHPVVKQVLAARGLKEAGEIEAFLNPSYAEHLHDPYLLTGMEQAVERILKAVRSQEAVVIYGDYDIDGITATAVMLETLRNLGLEATSYIPDRFEEGYGLNLAALKKLKAAGADLVITVDCGITSTAEVEWANANGLDIIITDHHNVPPQIPPALAVINPKRPRDKYPFKDLAGVGVAFKLAQALQERSGKPAAGQEKWLLDLVALGTVCDVVSLTGENRVLARYGLVVMNKTRRVGLRALAAVGGVEVGQLTSYHLGWVFGPRLNAAGRLEHAASSLRLLTTETAEEAKALAASLEELNRQRRDDLKAIVAEAEDMALIYQDDPVLVLANENWSHGIVGIAAGRIMERYRKPTLVLQILGKSTKGSARSTGDYNIVEALRSAESLLTKFGGHYFAAGCTLPTANLDKLRLKLNNHFRSMGLEPGEKDKHKEADVWLNGFGSVDWELLEQFDRLEPFGNGNPKPVLSAEAIVVAVRTVGVDNTHLKLQLTDDAGQVFEGIAFGLAKEHSSLATGQKVRVHFQLSKNEFQGKSSLELLVTHLASE